MEIHQRVVEMKFTFYDREYDSLVEVVTQFQYLGSTLEETDSDWLEVHRNISKFQVVWRSLGKLLQR